MAIKKPKNDNYLPMYSLKNRMDSLFDNFINDFSFGNLQESLLQESFSPKVNISETKDSFLVDAELPGVEKQDVKLKFDEGLLTIWAERKEEKEENKKNYHKMESLYGTFQRSIRLPNNIDRKTIDAQFKNGVLKVKLLKIKEEESKTEDWIKIK